MDTIRFHFDALMGVTNNTGVAGVDQNVVFHGHIVVQDALPNFLKGVAAMLSIDPQRVHIDKFEREPNTNMPVWVSTVDSEDMVVSDQVGIVYWDILPRD